MQNRTNTYYNPKLAKSKIRYINTIINIDSYKITKRLNSIIHKSSKKQINSSIIIKMDLIILYYIVLFYFICLNLVFECRPNEGTNYSYIILKSNKTGYTQIISDQFDNLPNEVIINGNDFPVKIGYYLNDSDNTIILIWNNQLNDTSNMFKGCSNITEIDLSNFDTSNVKNMNNMFYEASSLRSINLSNIDTSKIENMNAIFYGCSSLYSINLSNFETSKIVNMNGIFYGCSSLKSLDLSYFNSTNIKFMNYIFHGCSNLEFLNLKSAILKEEIINQILSINNLDNIIICSENNYLVNLSLIEQEINCYDANNNKILFNDEKEYKCYSNISKSLNNKNICRICGDNFFMKYDYNSNNNNSNIKCFDSQNGYYLDENDYLYKPCYNSCKTCDINGNESFHNCLECKNDYKYEVSLLNYKNCYKNNKEEFNNRGESIKSVIGNIFDEINITEIDNGKDKKIIEKDFMVILTSTINQKINEDINNITMNLGECENKLKNAYHIPNNDSLYILQIVSKEEGMKIPKMEYEIYYPFNGNLTKLDLISCKDTKIEISISVKINGSIDKYNSSSSYYNDICSKTTSESGTDISLKDRRNEFVENNMSLCEENCELIDYNYTNEKSKCSCDIKLKIPENYDIKFNKKDFYKNFIDIKNIANINILKCYKTVLKLKNLLKNYGFFIMFFILILYFITLIIFYCKSYIKLKKDIKNIYSAIKSQNKETKENKKINLNKKKKKKKKRRYKKKYKKNNIKNDYNLLELKNIDENERKDNKKQITLNEEEKSNHKIDIKSFKLVDINNKYIKDLLEPKDFELELIVNIIFH